MKLKKRKTIYMSTNSLFNPKLCFNIIRSYHIIVNHIWTFFHNADGELLKSENISK